MELPTYPADFNVYYCASLLVRQHQAAHLYQGADNGTDPQKALAPADSPLFQAAHAQGLTFVGLYVYPPILADLLIPYTFTPLPTATHLWLVSNMVALFLTALIVIRLLRLPFLSGKAALILLSLACFTPTLQCLVDGQITIFLLLLWAAGLLFYDQEQDLAAGAAFALAAAIKLTPAIVLLPLLLWKKWRPTAAFLVASLLLLLLSAFINTPQALHTYFTRVMPAMSGSIPYYTNYSLSAATQRLVALVHTGTIAAFPPSMPAPITLAGRLVSACAALALMALIALAGLNSTRRDQVLILALLGLMAPVLSPVSWFHAYSTAYLAFALLWYECFRQPTGTLYLIALTAVTLLLGSAISEKLLPTLLFSGHVAAAALLQAGQLVAATGLVFFRLQRMRTTPNASRATPDTPPSHPLSAHG